jgi:acyl-CoA reductase-like NAD-dependent aldehyde dehydrogenase
MLINGQRVFAKTSIDVVNPATGEVIGQVPEADAASIHTTRSNFRTADSSKAGWVRTAPATVSKNT